jgi:(R,R)-butanediol dehydrogenase / meso-butanediol dehydrogenase / diacetyl reductase
MRAVVFVGNGQIDHQDWALPKVDTPDGVVIKVDANAICGTDLHALEVPPTVIFRPGVIIGHEFAGSFVEARPSSGVVAGDRVGILTRITFGRCDWCRRGLPNLCIHIESFGSARVVGGAVEYAWAPGPNVFKLSDNLSTELASIAEPLSCVLNGTLRAGCQPVSEVVVMGGGAIGLIYAIVAHSQGVRSVTVVEQGAFRRAAAEDRGCRTVDRKDKDAMDRLRRVGADYVIDAEGTLIAEAVAIARPRAMILILDLDDTRRPPFPQADAVRKEVRIEGVFLARSTFALALEMLARLELGFERMITHKYELASFDEACNVLRRGVAMKALVIPAYKGRLASAPVRAVSMDAGAKLMRGAKGLAGWHPCRMTKANGLMNCANVSRVGPPDLDSQTVWMKPGTSFRGILRVGCVHTTDACRVRQHREDQDEHFHTVLWLVPDRHRSRTRVARGRRLGDGRSRCGRDHRMGADHGVSCGRAISCGTGAQARTGHAVVLHGWCTARAGCRKGHCRFDARDCRSRSGRGGAVGRG